MEDEKSEIIDFYPTDFQTDLNGKTQEWESVVLISFIDEKRLRKGGFKIFAITFKIQWGTRNFGHKNPEKTWKLPVPS